MQFYKKEKEVIEEVIKHIDKVEQCLQAATKTVRAYLKDDIKEAKLLAREARELESQADLIEYGMRDKLYLGAYMPLIREDIYKLVESVDRVANAAEACCDFFLNQRPMIPETLNSQFLDVAEKSMGIVEPLKESVLGFLKGKFSMEAVREYGTKVGLAESAVDKMEWDLTKGIFTSSLEFSQKIHLKMCLETIVEISDRAEDAADQLALASLKSKA